MDKWHVKYRKITHPGFVLVKEDLVAVLALDVSNSQVLGVHVAPQVVRLLEAASALCAQVRAASIRATHFWLNPILYT